MPLLEEHFFLVRKALSEAIRVILYVVLIQKNKIALPTQAADLTSQITCDRDLSLGTEITIALGKSDNSSYL